MNTLRYRPEIDGLRALAVLPVILFHMGHGWIPGGYLGVDIFFVISGYLITSIILKEEGRGQFSFKNFWSRRIRRILPAMLGMLIFTLLAGSLILRGTDRVHLGFHTIAALFSLANFSMWRVAGNYWGAAETSPLLHTWSLSVEEQFYLFFPPFLILLLIVLKKRVFEVFLAANVVSFALYLYGSVYHPWGTFYLLPTRAWQLGLGCLLAFLVLRKQLPLDRLASARWSGVGLVLILASVFLIDGEHPFHGQLALPVAGTLLILACCTEPQHWVFRILTWRPLTYIGRISYSLYLWHWPILVLGRYLQLQLGFFYPDSVAILLIFPAAMASYHFIEKPTRKRQGIIPYIFGIFLLTLTTAGALYSTAKPTSLPFETGITRWDRYMTQDFSPEDSLDFRTSRFVKSFGPENTSQTIVVLGDSHVGSFGDVLEELAGNLDARIHFLGIRDSNMNFLPEDHIHSHIYRHRARLIEQIEPDVILLVARWSLYADSDKRAEATISRIRELTAYSRNLLLLEQIPEVELPMNLHELQPYFLYSGQAPLPEKEQSFMPMGRKHDYIAARNMLESLESGSPKITLVRISDLFLNEKGEVLVLEGKTQTLYDRDHPTYLGTAMARDRLRNALSTALTQD